MVRLGKPLGRVYMQPHVSLATEVRDSSNGVKEVAMHDLEVNRPLMRPEQPWRIHRLHFGLWDARRQLCQAASP